MLIAFLALGLLQEAPAPDGGYDDSIRCAAATTAYSLLVTGEELDRMSRAKAGWTVRIRQVWDPQVTPRAQLERDVYAASDTHTLMLVEEPGRLFQIAVHCYNRIVAIAAEQQDAGAE